MMMYMKIRVATQSRPGPPPSQAPPAAPPPGVRAPGVANKLEIKILT
jgi:hypothetical protein